MAEQLTGRAYVRVDGTLYDTLPGAKLSNFAGEERDAVTGTRVLGFTTKTVPPTIDCDMVHSADMSLAALWAVTDATITFECDSGPVYVLGGGWCSKHGTINADGSGKLEGVQFMGQTCDEQLS